MSRTQNSNHLIIYRNLSPALRPLSLKLEMANARETRLSTTLKDYVTGNEIDNILEYDKPQPTCDNNIENINPLAHVQCNGLTNNVTFSTEHINTWKTVIMSYFDNKAELIKQTETLQVIRIKFKDNSNKEYVVKFNLYSSGSVVLQGAKCRLFEDEYLQILKDLVEKDLRNEDNLENTKINDLMNDSCDNGNATTRKAYIQETSTPVASRNNKKSVTPQERISNRKESLDNKLDSLFTMLATVNESLTKLVEIVSDVKRNSENVDNDYDEKHPLTIIIGKQLKDISQHVKD